jgi:hypothetical protein
MPAARLRPWTRPREAAWLLLCGATVRTCAPIALVVGTVLSLVNQGDVLASGMADERVAWKIAANLLIPFLTSSLGALLAVRRRVARPDAQPRPAR